MMWMKSALNSKRAGYRMLNCVSNTSVNRNTSFLLSLWDTSPWAIHRAASLSTQTEQTRFDDKSVSCAGFELRFQRGVVSRCNKDMGSQISSLQSCSLDNIFKPFEMLFPIACRDPSDLQHPHESYGVGGDAAAVTKESVTQAVCKQWSQEWKNWALINNLWWPNSAFAPRLHISPVQTRSCNPGNQMYRKIYELWYFA